MVFAAFLLLGQGCSNQDDSFPVAEPEASETTSEGPGSSGSGGTSTTRQQPTAVQAEVPAEFTVVAVPQASDGRSVMIGEAAFTGRQGGFVVIHSDEGGRSGIRGASAYLPPGTHRQVRIELGPPLASDAVLLAMLHLDDNANRAYDFPTADAPVEQRGTEVTMLFAVDVV